MYLIRWLIRVFTREVYLINWQLTIHKIQKLDSKGLLFETPNMNNVYKTIPYFTHEPIPLSWSYLGISSHTSPQPWWWCAGSWGTAHGAHVWPGISWSDGGHSHRSQSRAGSYYWRYVALSLLPEPDEKQQQNLFSIRHLHIKLAYYIYTHTACK